MNSTPHVSRRAALGAFGLLVVAGTAAAASPALASPAIGAKGRAPRPLNAPTAQGAIPFTAASVDKNSDGTWTVSYSAPGVRAVRVYVGADAERFTPAPLVGPGGNGKVVIRSAASRPWVKLVADRGGALVVASRYLGLSGVLNARDAGGYRTAGGQWVRSGLVYRTAALTSTAADQQLLNRLNIVTDNDLRTTAEVTATPDTVPAGARYEHLNVMGDSVSATMPAVTSAAESEQYMTEAEAGFVDSDTAKAAYKQLFENIANDRGATLYHCTAGKDRTGWASAVLLTLLGVDAQTVMNDYLLSNTYYLNSAAIQAELAAMPAAQSAVYEPFLAVEAQYLQAGLDRVQSEYGSMFGYVTKGLGVSAATVTKLRAKLLEGAPTAPQRR